MSLSPMSPPLEALGGAYGLKAVSMQSKRRAERRRDQNGWSGNGQGATNDSAEYQAAVRTIDGFPVEYSCLDDPRDSEVDELEVDKLRIAFDYEMVYRSSSELEKSRRSLEWSLLWNVARNLGLHNCNFKKQKPLFLGRRQLAASSENYVVGLSSLEFDKVDYQTKHCTILSDAADAHTICYPMKGKMTALVMGDSDVIKRYLELNIEKELNSRRVRIEEVKECRFVGDRGNIRTRLGAPNGLDSKSGNISIAVVFGAVAAAFMLSFVFLLIAKRRREAFLDDDGSLVDPVPPVMFQLQGHVGLEEYVHHSSSSDTDESLLMRTDSFSNEDSKDKDEQLPERHQDKESLMVTNRRSQDVEIFSSSVQDKTEDERKECTVTPPPLVPVAILPVDDGKAREPSKSKTLQTRRKRKKKKRPRVLKRVSSRNSFDEMETIQEKDEGVDEVTSSEFDGSEYTTDEDDGTLFLSSDSHTDCGQDPLSPTRHGVLGDLIPPSPIREEPKIRRLPPPWI